MIVIAIKKMEPCLNHKEVMKNERVGRKHHIKVDWSGRKSQKEQILTIGIYSTEITAAVSVIVQDFNTLKSYKRNIFCFQVPK